MNSILQRINLANIIAPGEIYFLLEVKGPRWEPETIEYIYLIKSDEEIMPAIDMQISLDEDYELKKFIGWRRLSPACIEFRLLSYDRTEKKHVPHALYLHRIKTVHEIRELFGMDTHEDL